MVLFGVSVNWLAVLVGAIGAMIIGMIYYSPPLFGKMMMETAPRSGRRGNQRPHMGSFVGAFIAALFTAFLLEVLVKAVHIASLSSAFELAAVIWLGAYVSLELVSLSFGMKSTKMFVVNVVHHAIALGVIAAIVYVMH